MEYDHLDYSRPGSSFKPHYKRMDTNDDKNMDETNNLDNPYSSPSKYKNDEKSNER